MNCPSCPETVLSMTERQGVEIDYCPKCRGVWLDRGELDKIIEKTAASMEQTAPVGVVQGQGAQTAAYQGDPRDYRDHRDQQHYKHKRRKNFLEELFD